MRRTLEFFCLFLLLALPVAAQNGQRTANPPVVNIQISGVEPRPPDFPAELEYGGMGGGGGGMIAHNGVFWADTPGAFAGGHDADFNACGYKNMQAPTATLVYPDGRSQQINVSSVDQTNHCFSYAITWQSGLELGIYTLTLDHPDGQLTHTWGMDYPFCRTATLIDQQQWLMGFAPNEQLTVAFFGPGTGDASHTTYIASRNLQVDDQGTLALAIKVARSAPFTANQLSFVILGPQREIYYPPSDTLDLTPFTSLGYLAPALTLPPPLYPTYGATNGSGTVGGTNCDSDYGTTVEIVPSSGASIPLYADVNSSTITGQANAGVPADVTEYRPVMSNGRVIVWKHLLLEDGSSGWNPSGDFAQAYAMLVPGSHVELAAMSIYDQANNTYHTSSPVLYSSPNPSAAEPSSITPGTPMTALGYRVVSNNRWWYVQFSGGGAWLPEVDLVGQAPTMSPPPWAPVDVNQPGAIWKTCPGSPPTRLVPYIKGRVTPGQPNRLRSQPENGSIVGQIPPGDSFMINSGPVCGATAGLTWWNVTYKDQQGWTAEGQGDQYWVEPIP